MALIAFADAKQHLRIPSDETDHDGDIALKLAQAEALVLDRCNSTAYWRAITATWTDVTVPPAVTAAICLVLAHLYENRGDNMEMDADFWAAIDRVINLHKDPVIA